MSELFTGIENISSAIDFTLFMSQFWICKFAV